MFLQAGLQGPTEYFVFDTAKLIKENTKTAINIFILLSFMTQLINSNESFHQRSLNLFDSCQQF